MRYSSDITAVEASELDLREADPTASNGWQDYDSN